MNDYENAVLTAAEVETISSHMAAFWKIHCASAQLQRSLQSH